MAKHEQAVIDAFNRFITRKAEAQNIGFRSFPLDGQDVTAGADYLITDETRFALIEFKYTQAEIDAESLKWRRVKLCKLLAKDLEMQARHDQCHFIAWAERPSGVIQTNIYRQQICNQHFLGSDCELKKKLPDSTEQRTAMDFANEFFASTSSRSLSLEEFEIYLAWLLTKSSESSHQTLELATHDESTNECAVIKLASVRIAYEWMQEQKLRLTHTRHPKGI